MLKVETNIRATEKNIRKYENETTVYETLHMLQEIER